MLLTDIKLAVPASILCSDRLFEEGFKQLNPITKSGKINQKDLLCKATFDFSPYIQSILRDEDVTYATSSWVESGNIDITDCLKRLQSYFLEWKGNCFEVKIEHLEGWLSFCSLVDPTWIISSAYNQLIEDEILTVIEAIDLITNIQCHIALSKGNRNKTIADNHVHIGGHGTSSLSMLNFALYLEKNPENITWPKRVENSLFESEKFDKNDLPIIINRLANSLGENIFGLEKYDEIAMPSMDLLFSSNLSDSLLTDLKTRKFTTPAQQFLGASNVSNDHNHSRWILFALGLLSHKSINKEDTKHFQSTLSCFIRSSNITRNYMIHSGVGLKQFVSFFGFKNRRVDSNYDGLEHRANGLKYDLNSNTQREFRISPPTSTSLKHFAKAIINNHRSINTHFVVHFTRGIPKYSTKEDKYQKGFRAELQKQVNKLHHIANSVTYKDHDVHLGENFDQKESIDLRKLIRGYDVAGNENELQIEIFAPTLRTLRGAKFKSLSIFSKRMPQPFLTVHSGEDFSHLLSGLRAIDETVVFCDFKEGDRLGHALALGVGVSQWVRRQQRAYLTVGEHLDNLVWSHHQALHLIEKDIKFSGVLSLIEHKIRYWSEYVYKEVYTPNVLYQSWLLRRNCPKAYETFKNDCTALHSEMVVDHDYLTLEKDSKAITLWQQYIDEGHLGSTINPCKRNEIISIDCFGEHNLTSNLNNSFVSTLQSSNKVDLTDTISQSELQLYEAIQDWLMERYSKRGVIIEACPTSNIYIGRFKFYHEHPIFRWSPPDHDYLKVGGKFNKHGLRNGAVPVCINTDDSAIMPTTIANEHRVLKNAAIKHFCVGTNMAELWIERIQRLGVDLFEHNHLDWVNE
jgi:hypothetical protein